MKIGIFGDSFASAVKLNDTAVWHELLGEKYNVTVHALGGSNLYYSVRKFIKFHEQYDKIIFVVTMPGRQQIADWIPCADASLKCVPGLTQAEALINNKATVDNKYLKEAYGAVINYFKYMQIDHYDNYIHKLMCDDIVKRRPDAIMIPAFSNSVTDVKKNSLQDVYIKENRAWGYEELIPGVPQLYYDNRNCHLTAENNVILASKVDSWIQGMPVVIDINDFVTPLNKEFYLVKNND